LYWYDDTPFEPQGTVMPAETVNVRYMVDDVEAAVAWYTTHLGFTLLSKHAPAFADVASVVAATSERGDELGRQAHAGR
jgi:catechol 2,3-dioxygenase-like lactoylglutathione lyase family enzyme